jgi:4-hydroxy-3-methylbut-2-enyl diphosphate reductase
MEEICMTKIYSTALDNHFHRRLSFLVGSNSDQPMQVTLAQPRGFCAGVVRAIKIVERALEIYGTTVHVLHEIVHNHHVVEDLKSQGASFIEKLDNVPSGAVTIFSAHGVSTAVVKEAEKRKLKIIDATCPLVTKVHLQAQRYSRAGFEVIIIGHPGHPEVEATRGCVDGPVRVLAPGSGVDELSVRDPGRLAYVTQTTLSMDETSTTIEGLRRRFPGIQGPDLKDICYATQNRQQAVHRLAARVDMLLVVGSRNSSNSNRLREVAAQHGVPAYLIEEAGELEPRWLAGCRMVGITAGASTPEVLVHGVVDWLRDHGMSRVREMRGTPESRRFRLPSSLSPGGAGPLPSRAVSVR